MNGLVSAAAAVSTCAKRVTVCVILDALGNVLSCESNRCSPPGGVCSRLGVSNTKENYPAESCNWQHAERRALSALPAGSVPTKAVLLGHDFYCDDCERALRERGITELEISPTRLRRATT